MLALVKYSGNQMETCSKRKIAKRNDVECIVKHKGCNYQGKISVSRSE